MEPIVRGAKPDDVEAIHQFGAEHIRPHYAPLIGTTAADEQVQRWWNHTQLQDAVTSGSMIVAEAAGQIVGVGQRGRRGADHVVYKLYVSPDWRGHGLGPRLLDTLIDQLPPDTDRLYIEHFAANTRAGAFYEREGFTVDRIDPSASGNPALDVVWRSRPTQQ